MISLFIFTSNIRGMQYGMGTYISKLTNLLINFPNVEIYFIFYYSFEYKEYTVVSSANNIKNIYIPALVLGKSDKRQNQKYAARVVDLISEFINNVSNAVFYINYPAALPIVKQLKLRFSYPIVSIIHSARFQILLNGNKQEFIKIWKNQNDKKNLNVLEELIEEKEFYLLADRIISVTDYMKEFVTNYYDIPKDKITVIRNGIDISKSNLLNKQMKNILKKELGFKAKEKIILFSGRLDANKGLIFLLEAFKDVVKQYKDIRLILVGEDSGAEKISQLLSYCTNTWSRITFTGFLKYEDCQKFYQIADIGIIPSIYDHCPYVALEMMSYKIPLIISNTEGLNEMLAENQCIFLNPIIDNEGNIEFDKNEITNSILLLVNEEKKAKQISKDYLAIIKSKFSDQRMVNETYDVLSNFLISEV